MSKNHAWTQQHWCTLCYHYQKKLSCTLLLRGQRPDRKHGFTRVLGSVAHGGVLFTFSNISAPDRDKWCGSSGPAAWTIHHVQNHTMPGHSPPVSQAGRRIVSPLAFGLIGVGFPPTIKTGEFFWMFFHVFTIKAFAVFFSVPPVRGKGDGIFFWPVTPKTITTVLFPALLFFTL